MTTNTANNYFFFFFVLIEVVLTAVVATTATQQSSSKRFYTHTGVHFLNQYSRKYNLLSKFLISNNSKILYPNTSLSADIRSSYKIRDYNNYANWELHAIVDRNRYSDDANVSAGYYAMDASLEYVPENLRPAAYYYNNRYRYGSDPADRFIAIVFKNDPWLDENAYVSFLSTPDNYNLTKKNGIVQCSFTYPIKASSNFQYIATRPHVQRCEIPIELSRNLTKQHSYIGLNLIHEGGVILKNIKVQRLNRLDRRSFNTSSYIMTYNLHDAMLVEWITYNLMLGVEHFYIYDNRRLYPPPPAGKGKGNNGSSSNGAMHYELRNSPLIPFLDANLVTLIHFAISPSTDNPTIDCLQELTFSYVLEQFGKYNKYITFNDYDEFFIPSVNYQKLLHARDQPSTYFTDILTLFDNINSTQRYPDQGPSVPIDSLAFNTLDMGCNETEQVDTHEVRNHVPDRKRSSNVKTAASTHCSIEGVMFRQYGVVNGSFVNGVKLFEDYQFRGHGKVIVKTSGEGEELNCHMTSNPWLGTEYNGGIFCHYTNLRLSILAAGEADPKLYKSVLSPSANLSCRDFALKLVQLYVKIVKSS